MPRFSHSRYVTILDQVVSSLSNFALVTIVANVTSSEEFGRFSLGYVLLLFFLGFQRSLVGEVLLVRFSAEGPRASGVDGAASGVSLGVGVVSAVVVGVCGLVVGGDATVWAALALAGPVAFLQDVARYVLIARRLSGFALVSDAVWVVVAIPVMLWLAATGGTAGAVVLVWVAGAAVAGAVALRAARLSPRPVRGARWLVDNRDIAVRFSAEYGSLNLSNTIVWFALAGPIGVAGVAALRGASLLFSPLNTAFNAVRIAVVPELVRAGDPRRYRARIRETALILAGLGVGWSAAVLLLPSDWGAVVLGDTWDAAAGQRWPYAAQAVAMVGYTLLLAHFRARALHSASTRMRGTLAALTLGLPICLALLAAATGAAWGFAAAVLVSVAVGAVLARRQPADPPTA